MKIKLILTILIILFLAGFLLPKNHKSQAISLFKESKPIILSQKQFDLSIRYPEKSISDGFSDNILLSLHYLKNDVGALPIDWNRIKSPFTVTFTLKPNETFAFHNNVLPEFTDFKYSINSKFYTDEGYKYVAGLGGNGVCHLASFINWVASDAGMTVIAKVNHDFFPVPGVPRSYGTSIFSQSQDQNLYIRNNQNYPVTFEFNVTPDLVDLKIVK